MVLRMLGFCFTATPLPGFWIARLRPRTGPIRHHSFLVTCLGTMAMAAKLCEYKLDESAIVLEPDCGGACGKAGNAINGAAAATGWICTLK